MKKQIKGFTATHGLENAKKGPYFWWKDGKCTNAMTINSWWHQNFILEYESMEVVKYKDPNQMNLDL